MAAVATATVLTLGVASRALFLRDPQHAESMHGFWASVFEPWAHWDGVWFVRIAADGYAAHPWSPAFFPLYPLTVRAASVLTEGNLVIAGVLVSLVCYAASMVVLFRLTRDELGPQAALWTVVFVSLFPTALVFQAAYSESLFLLLTLLCLSLARRGRWASACAAGLLAALTRSTGVLLLLPLAMIWWEQRRGRCIRLPGGPATRVTGPVLGTALAPRPAVGRLTPSSVLWLLLVPAGLGLYMAYLWGQYGNPLLFATVQGNWGRHPGLPFTTLWQELVAVAAARAFARRPWARSGPRAHGGRRLPRRRAGELLRGAGVGRRRVHARRLLAAAAGPLHRVRGRLPAVPAPDSGRDAATVEPAALRARRLPVVHGGGRGAHPSPSLALGAPRGHGPAAPARHGAVRQLHLTPVVVCVGWRKARHGEESTSLHGSSQSSVLGGAACPRRSWDLGWFSVGMANGALPLLRGTLRVPVADAWQGET